MSKELDSIAMKEYNFLLEREKLLKGLEVAAQNKAEAAKLHEEMQQLYQQTAIIKVTSRILRKKITITLNKHSVL